jgi:hypothetical protein
MGGLELEARLGNKVFGLLKLESVGMVPQAWCNFGSRLLETRLACLVSIGHLYFDHNPLVEPLLVDSVLLVAGFQCE